MTEAAIEAKALTAATAEAPLVTTPAQPVLASSDLIQNKPYVSRPLAVRGLGHPTLGDDGNLTMLAKPIYITTTLSHARMMGRAYRDMVVPSMLPDFIDAIQKRSMDSPRKLQMILGGAGLGKSYMARSISNLRAEDPLVVTEVGNKSLTELLFETVIDPNNTVGIGTKNGKLIEAWTEGRELLVDEWNKSKPGSDAALQLTLQVLSGEIDEHTVLGGAGKSFTFRRSDMKPGFFMTATGNFTEDGSSTYELAASAYSRLQPRFLKNAGLRDWQHRFCQLLTGLPISTLYYLNQPYWDANPSQFLRVLRELRELGLTETEKKLIPSWQRSFISSWQDVVAASEKIATFYVSWCEILAAKGRITSDRKADIPPAILSELNDMYVRRVTVDMRRMAKHIAETLEISPPTQALTEDKKFNVNADFAAEPPPGLIAREPIERHFGHRFVRALIEDIRQTTEPFGKPNIEKALFELATTGGLIPPETKGNAKPPKSVIELLNCNAVDGIKISPELLDAQKRYCDYLRRRFSGLPDENESIMPAANIGQAMATIDEQENKTRPGYASIALFDPDAVVSGDPRALPLVAGQFADLFLLSSFKEKAGEEATRLKQAKFLSTEDFLLALSLPEYGARNIKALWHSSIGEVTGRKDLTAVQMADNVSPTQLAITAVVCKNDDSPSSLVVISNQQQKKTAVFGSEHIRAETQDFLRASGLTYVNVAKGITDIERTVDEIVGTTDRVTLKTNLAQALGLRSKPENTRTIAQMIARPAFNHPVFALKSVL